jgi:hypothetical protein
MSAEKQATLRAGAAVLLSGINDAALRGARGFLLPTETLPNPSWSADRVTVCLTEPPAGRVTSIVAVKPTALSICCAGCWTPQDAGGRAFKSCARCMGPRYCGADCQKRDWTARHKAECKRLSQVRETQDASPAWGADVGPAHAFPWRLTLETPAMQSKFPSFLTSHPNQRFLCGLAQTPQRARLDLPIMPVLREDFGSDSGPAYFDRVPMHHPFRTILGVVGECTFTNTCMQDFVAHFDHNSENRGALFRWPPAAMVWLDLADGESLKPGISTLIMVVQMISGTISSSNMVTGGESGMTNIATRVMPRLIKKASLQKLCGSNSMMVTGMRPPIAFPELVQMATAARGGRARGGRAYTAGGLWEAASSAPENIMTVFEAVMRDELKEVNSKLGMDQELQPVGVS